MWVRMRTRLALENLFLENPSFWNCYRHALTQIDHGSYHSLVHANRYNADTHQKGLGQKKASTICTETAKKKKKHSSWYTTANRQRQHCQQMQVKQRKGKGKMMLGNYVGPKRCRKQASYHRVPTAVSEEQSFQPFQDTPFIPLGWCCPVINPQGHWHPSGAAFWLGLIAQCPFCGYADKAGRPQLKSTACLTSWVTEHSTAVTCAELQFSLLPSSGLP